MTKDKLTYYLLIWALVGICPSRADVPSVSISRTVSNIYMDGTANSANIDTNQNQSDKSTASTTYTNNQSSSKSNKAAKTKLSKKVFSIAAALVIGTPVCIVRRTKYEEWYEVNGLVGDSANKCKKALAGIVCFPIAVICGTGEAPFDAMANGLMYPAFSKDQLSQGKLIQNN